MPGRPIRQRHAGADGAFVRARQGEGAHARLVSCIIPFQDPIGRSLLVSTGILLVLLVAREARLSSAAICSLKAHFCFRANFQIGQDVLDARHLGVAGAHLIKECLQARREQRIFPGKDPENE
jgi:hypothetical protein